MWLSRYLIVILVKIISEFPRLYIVLFSVVRNLPVTVRPGEPVVTSDTGARPSHLEPPGATWSRQILPINDLILTSQLLTEQQQKKLLCL